MTAVGQLAQSGHCQFNVAQAPHLVIGQPVSIYGIFHHAVYLSFLPRTNLL